MSIAGVQSGAQGEHDEFAAVEADHLARDSPLAVGLPDCDMAGVAWSGETWTQEFDLTCDAPDSVGPQQPLDEPERPYLWSGVTMSADAGWFAFEFDASGATWVDIVRCDRPENVYLWADEPRADAYLEGGRYLVLADAYIDANASATVTVQRLAEAPDDAAVHDAPPAGFLSRLHRDSATLR